MRTYSEVLIKVLSDPSPVSHEMNDGAGTDPVGIQGLALCGRDVRLILVVLGRPPGEQWPSLLSHGTLGRHGDRHPVVVVGIIVRDGLESVPDLPRRAALLGVGLCRPVVGLAPGPDAPAISDDHPPALRQEIARL